MITGVAVVIPARNEEDSVGAALVSVLAAAARIPPRAHIVVVCDACDDRTREVAAARLAGWGRATVMSIDAGSVGAARDAGWRVAAAAHTGNPAGLWVAGTDADGAVPADWLAHQLELAGSGADVVCGTVSVADWSRHSDDVRRRYLAAYRTPGGGPHRHVHGANLGVRGSVLRRLGGVPALAAHEDRALVARAAAAGAHVVATDRIPVATSARTDGRAPEGFSGVLRALTHAADGHAAAALGWRGPAVAPST